MLVLHFSADIQEINKWFDVIRRLIIMCFPAHVRARVRVFMQVLCVGEGSGNDDAEHDQFTF